MKLLDLYCGAGMAADGYAAAGFDVSGVDIVAQPDYPYPFERGDALAFISRAVDLGFRVIHASPPCQAHTRAKHLRAAQGKASRFADLLTPTLAALRAQPLPWIVENVCGAPGMEGAVICCGSSFGLGVRRHRLFLSDAFALVGTKCDHKAQGRPWGVYYAPNDSIPKGGRTARDAAHGCEVMGVARTLPWNSLKEGFPPAYTEHIGKQAMKALLMREVA